MIYLRRSLSPVLPNRGVAAAMESGKNDDTVSFCTEVHTKRESLGDDKKSCSQNQQFLR
jgi:hypothetical protein